MDESSGSLATPAPGGPTSPTPAAPGPPLDPFAPNWTDEQWGEKAGEAGMQVSHFREYFPPAQEVLRQVAPEFIPLLEEIGVGNQALGDNGQVIEAFGRYAVDRRRDRQELDRLRQQDATLAQQLGERPSPPPRMAPLRGERLQRQIVQLLDRYFPSTSMRGALDHLGTDPQLVRGLTQLVQDEYRRQQEVRHYGQAVERRRGKLEQPETIKTLPTGQRASNDQLDADIDETRRALYEADKQGRRDEKARHLRKLETLFKSRYGRGGAA